nr:hypothetical protein [Tanacetum cinerariifolium]
MDCLVLKVEVVVAIVREVVLWPEEAMVDWPNVRYIRIKVEVEEDRWFFGVDLQGKVKRGGVNFGVVNSLLGEIPREVMGERERGEETSGIDGGSVW